MSDALKRCAMRLGVTLHLWSGAEFSLYDQLSKDRAGVESALPAPSTPAPNQAAPVVLRPRPITEPWKLP